jgi:hypothetical protein
MIKNIREKLEKMTGRFDADYWMVISSEMFNLLMLDVDSFLSISWCKKFVKPNCKLNKVLETL